MSFNKNMCGFGIGIFKTTSALLNGFEIYQAALGSQVHKPGAPEPGPIFTPVITTLFTLSL